MEDESGTTSNNDGTTSGGSGSNNNNGSDNRRWRCEACGCNTNPESAQTCGICGTSSSNSGEFFEFFIRLGTSFRAYPIPDSFSSPAVVRFRP